MTKFDRVSIGRKTTPEGEMVVFIKGTEVLTEIPIEMVRKAVALVEEFQGKTSGCSVTFSENGVQRVHIGSWWAHSGIVVTLLKLGDLTPLGTWDMIEVDPF